MSNIVDIDHLNVDLSKCDYLDVDFRYNWIYTFSNDYQDGKPVGTDFRFYPSYDDFKNHNSVNNIFNSNLYYKEDSAFKDTFYNHSTDYTLSEDPEVNRKADNLKYYFPLGSYFVIQRGTIASPITEAFNTKTKLIYDGLNGGYLIFTAVPLSYENKDACYVTFDTISANSSYHRDIRTVRVTDADYNTVGYTLRVYKVNADGTPVTSGTSRDSGSSEKWVHGRDKLIAENPALFYSNRFKKVVYDFSKPWTMVSGISKEQFYRAKDDQQSLLTYFPYKEMSAKNNSKSGFNYLKGDIYLDYNDFAGFFLRCSNSSGVQVNSDYTKGDFIAAVDFGLKWTLMDIDIVNSAAGVYSYSDIYNDDKSLWVASTTGSGRDKANFVFKDTCLCEVNGFSSPIVYIFNLNDVPDIRDHSFNNGIYKESEAQGYKGELFNFTYPKSFSELSSKSDEELINMTLDDYTFTKGVVSIKFTDNANDPIGSRTSTVFIRTVGDEFSKIAGMAAFNIQTGIGKMFTISVPEEYYINAIFFSYGLGLGHGLLVNGKVIPNNLTSNGIVNDTSLPIYPIDSDEVIWKANGKNLTSVSFADIFSQGSSGRREISAIYVSYAKKEEALVPPTISDIDTGKGSLKAVDLGLSVKWASRNIGATEETDSGDHYAWGSIQTSNTYNQSSYEWYDASTGTYKIPATNIAETKYDVAAQILRGKWRMPTEDEFNELIDKCTWIATDNGFRVVGPNKNEIFLPFTGVGIETGLEGSNKMFYWSCKYNELPSHKEDHWAYYLTNYTSKGEKNPTVISSYVYNGMCIRPVEDDNLTPSTPDTPSEKPSNLDLPSGNVDTSMSPTTLVFTDTGTVGYSVDPNEILYAGGQEVIPKTFAQKDNTLFMANYKEKNALITDKSLFSSIRTDTHLGFKYKDSVSKGSLGSLYMYDNQLKHNSYDITTFKGGEVYRFGLVFQDSRGQWSGVVPLYDYRNTLYPNDKEDKVDLVKAVATIPSSLSKRLYNLGYRRVQGVVVYPSEANRRVVCQGVLCPTVYNINDRKNNSPYAVSSWFFREMRAESSDGTYSVKGTQNLHNCNIYNDIYDGIKDKLKVKSKLVTDTAERYLRIGGSTNGSSGTFEGGGGYFGNGRRTSGFSGSRSVSNAMVTDPSLPLEPVDLTAPSTDFKAELSTASIYHKYAYESYNNVDYFVDWNTLTMNTPEVNFSTANTSHNILTENLKLRIIGVIPLTSSSNDIYVNTNSEYIKQDAGVGLKKKITTYSNNSPDGGDIRTVAFDWQDYDFHLGDKDNVVLDSTDKQCIMPDFSFNNIDLILYSALGIQEAMFGGIKAYPLYPWQGAKSLLGQPKEVTDNKDYKDYEGKMFDGLNKKIISNIRTSSITYYFRPTEALSYNIGNAGIYDGDIPLVKLNRDSNDSDFTGSFNYYGELDSVINPTSYYYTYFGSIYFYGLADYKRYAEAHRSDSSPTSIGKNVGLHNIMQNSVTNDPVRIRYKSSPHIAFHLNYTSDGKQEILPYFKYKGYSFGKFDNLDVYKDSSTKYAIPGWSEKTRKLNSSSGVYSSTTPLINQRSIDLQYYNLMNGQNVYFTPLYGYLYIGELYQDLPKDLSEIFGGTSPMAYEQNQWHKAGPVAELNTTKNIDVEFLQGDTYYQRYDCLKTYPFSSEDPNQIVEILSFMCETRMNIDGRYDINRGNSSNLNATPQNFNLFNPVYTQENNFINNYYLDPEKNKDDNFSNSLLWTKTKTLGEEIDSWTNVNQASTFNMDGDKGAISAVRNYNDNLVTFQDNGIARILYNERVQINASDGVPIELSNSGKVSGKQYLSDTIGCSNKNTIQITPNGIYFMDSNSKDICLFNNGIQSVSKTKGFNNYLYDKDFNKYKTFYDEKLKDVYFTDDVTSLDFSEQLGEFEGFYSYGGTDYMFNYLDNFIAIKDNKLWKQFAGDYNYFFGNKNENCEPFSITLISNEGVNDKTFTGMEYEADTWDSKDVLLNETFDYLNVWNEYQIGVESLNSSNINKYYHFSNLKKKFRIWRAQMPRELDFKHTIYLPDINKEIDIMNITERSIDIKKLFDLKQSLNRIRNTWAYIKLSKNSIDNHKTILHNIKIDYFN